MRTLLISTAATSAIAGWLDGIVHGEPAVQSPLLPLGQPKAHSPFTKEFEKLVNETLDKFRVPGIAIAVVDGHDIHSQGFGFASVPDSPATGDTLWCVGSTTKAFTDATLSHLIHQDQHPSLQPLGWSTAISSLIRDDFVVEDEWATQHLTLDDAASHRTGMSRHDLSYSTHDEDGKPVSLRDSIRKFRYLPMYEQPRVVFQYCNLMYMVLSHVVETLTGRGLRDVMRDLIWTPLGMNSTFFGYEDIPCSAQDRMADAYYFDHVDGEYKVIPPMSLSYVSGAGAIISSANDYARWVHALLHRAPLFSEQVHDDIRRPRMMEDETGDELYGLGWIKSSYHGHRQYFHNGGTDGFGTNMFWYPDDGYGVVAFGNTPQQSHTVHSELLNKLINDRLGVDGKLSLLDSRDASSHGEIHTPRDGNNKDPYQCDFNKGDEMVFPTRPQIPIQLPGNISDLAGSYRHPGYGTFNFTLESVPEQDAAGSETGPQLRLVASKPSSPWRYRLDLRHTSGPFFLACMSTVSPEFASGLGKYRKAEFRIDVSGKGEGVWIDMENMGETQPRANIWFGRVN